MADDFRTTEVGGRYAQALFDLADETGALDAVRGLGAYAEVLFGQNDAKEGGAVLGA